MQRIFYLSLCCFLGVYLLGGSTALYAQDPTAAGPYSFAQLDTTIQDGIMTNASLKFRVYWPQQSGAWPAGLVAPVIAFGHGFQITYTNYTNLYEHLASWGYIVLAPDEQNNPLSISHQTFARQMAGGIQFIQAEGQRVGSRFAGRVAATSGVFGHSMGGGASMLVPGEWAGITAVAGLTPAETNPSAIAALATVDKPLLIISSRKDGVTPESTNQIPMYDAAQGPKTRISLLEGGHCNFTNAANFLCDFGATTSNDAGTLTHAQQRGLSLKYLVPFFEYHLKGDTTWLPYICGEIAATDAAVEHFTNVPCAGDTLPDDTTARHQVLQNPLRGVYPNPVRDGYVTVPQAGMYRLMDAKGRIVWQATAPVAAQTRLQLGPLPTGVYLLEETNSQQRARLYISE